MSRLISHVTRNVSALSALTAALLIPAGCGAGNTRSTHTHTKAGPLVRYERTGGIAGVDDRVEVFAGGAVIVHHRRGLSRRARLSKPSMRDLRHALIAAHFEQPLPPPPPTCSDCFSFRLAYGGHRLSFSQLGAPARVDAILRILTALADRY